MTDDGESSVRREPWRPSAVLRKRIDKVLAWHHKRESATGASGPWCAADGHPWPCETVKILTGEVDHD